jgi:PAS domain S-box-containing protein
MVQVGGRTCLAVVWHDVTESKRLADALQAREQYQRALLDNFPFMVWLKDEESRFLAVNAAFARVFGWPSAEALIGKCDLDIAPPDLAERYRADDQRRAAKRPQPNRSKNRCTPVAAEPGSRPTSHRWPWTARFWARWVSGATSLNASRPNGTCRWPWR